MFAPYSQLSPSQTGNHFRRTVKTAIPPTAEPSSPSLNCFDAVTIVFSVWVPYGATVFDVWSNKADVCLGFNVSWGNFEISPHHTQCSVCLAYNIANMTIPAEVGCEGYAEVFGRCYTLESGGMECVRVNSWVSAASEGQRGALGGIEVHFPIAPKHADHPGVAHNQH